MRSLTFYRIAIALPAVAALGTVLAAIVIANPAFLVLALLTAFFEPEIERKVGLLLLAVLFSPVLLGCIALPVTLLRRLRDQPEPAWARASRRAPIWLGIVTIAAACVFLGVVTGFDRDALTIAFIVGVVSTFFAYVYVVVAAILFALLRALSIVRT